MDTGVVELNSGKRLCKVPAEEWFRQRNCQGSAKQKASCVGGTERQVWLKHGERGQLHRRVWQGLIDYTKELEFHL